MTTPTPILLTIASKEAGPNYWQNFSLWLTTPFGGFVCHLFYILFTLVAVVIILSLSYKIQFIRVFADKIIKTFASHCFSDVTVSAIESFSQKFPDIIIEKITVGINSLVEQISEGFAGKTIKVDKLTISPRHMEASIVTPEIPKVIYKPELPSEVTNQIPELKTVEELFGDSTENYDKILSECTKGLAKYSTSDDRYYFNVLKARALIAKKEYQTALKELNEALELCSSDSEIYFYIGKCKRHLKDYKESETNFNKAISLDDQESKYFIELGLLYYKWGKIDGAIEVARKAHELYEKEEIDKNSPAYLELHNQLEFYYCMKFDETGDIKYMQLAQEINDWFENVVAKQTLKNELDKGYLNDTMGYFYLMKSIEEEDPQKKNEYIKKALEIQSKAVEFVPDEDVIERLLRIIRISISEK